MPKNKNNDISDSEDSDNVVIMTRSRKRKLKDGEGEVEDGANNNDNQDKQEPVKKKQKTNNEKNDNQKNLNQESELKELPGKSTFKEYLDSLDEKYQLPSNLVLNTKDPNFDKKLDPWNQNNKSQTIFDPKDIQEKINSNINLELEIEDDDDSEEYRPSTEESYSDEDFSDESYTTEEYDDEMDTEEFEEMDAEEYEEMADEAKQMILRALTQSFENTIKRKYEDDELEPPAQQLTIIPIEDISSGSTNRRRLGGEPPAKRQKLDAMDTKYLQLLKPPTKEGPLGYFMKMSNEEKKKMVETEERVRSLSHFTIPERIRVMNSNIPDEAKSQIIHRMEQGQNSFGDEGVKIKEWVNSILEIPFNVYRPLPITKNDSPQEIQQFMNQTYQFLDNAVYGHTETKCHLLQIIGKWITNPGSLGNCLALQGPPGVGKTTIIKEGLSKIFHRPFHFLSLGGAKDSSILEGHSFTYVGSIPGQIIKILQQSQCMNPIIYFDELDKISADHKGEEIANLLVHLIDTQQNDKFHDK